AMIDILEPIDPNTLNARQNKTLDTLITTSQNMLTALNETLHIGNIEVRKTRLNIEPVDIYKLGQEVNELIINDTRQRGLELIYFFAPDCPRSIGTDEVRLRQILLNLLHNAVKFTPSGHVALIIEQTDYEQMSEANKETLQSINKNLTADAVSCWVRFSVQDTGIGITSAKQHQLLSYLNKPHSQDINPVAQNAIDAGLGLKNVNSFARLLGGFIELTSTVNEGSVFNLYLPCRRPNYQSVYHPSQHLNHICLIAVVHQPLVAQHLQRLCEHLAISSTIYTAVDLATIEQLTERLSQDQQSLAPILLLDYEYYDTSAILVGNKPDTDSSAKYQNSLSQEQADLTKPHLTQSNHIVTSIDRRQALNSLLANTSLPKILFSMKSERRIPSMLLDQCDGFLAKPLDSALLLSEILRLTMPARKKLTQTQDIKENISETTAQEESSQPLSPLILVVEDSPTNQKIACKMLSKLGYRSIVAEDGQQA
ncbi:MAG: ATP-binding protein, partial [Pseudomonadota bacterium]|nr:ATP-binding protein [Pseudomonadota bacterium]